MKKIKVGQIIRVNVGCAVKKAYKQLCDEFGFKLEKIGHFDKQKRLFAEKSAPNGEDSTWFIIYSNVSNRKKDKEWVINDISDDEKTLTEKFIDLKNVNFNDADDKRHLFIRTKKVNEYKFLGVFECQSKDFNTLTRVWMKIQDL